MAVTCHFRNGNKCLCIGNQSKGDEPYGSQHCTTASLLLDCFDVYMLSDALFLLHNFSCLGWGRISSYAN